LNENPICSNLSLKAGRFLKISGCCHGHMRWAARSGLSVFRNNIASTIVVERRAR